MKNPIKFLLKVFAVMVGIVIYLNAVEVVLPAARKADRLPTLVACVAADYQAGACL